MDQWIPATCKVGEVKPTSKSLRLQLTPVFVSSRKVILTPAGGTSNSLSIWVENAWGLQDELLDMGVQKYLNLLSYPQKYTAMFTHTLFIINKGT